VRDYLIKRLIFTLVTIVVLSICIFAIVQIPPGDAIDTMAAARGAQGDAMSEEEIQQLRVIYGLDRPIYVQYLKWVAGMLHGDFGQSLTWKTPVKDLIWERIGLTFVLSLGSLVFIWIVAFPVGIYSAIRQYSVGDHVFTFLSFVGLGIPPFLLALVVMWLAFSWFGISVGGLFSVAYVDAPWGWRKLLDLLKHLWIPMVVLGMGGTAGLIRIMRANLLDELHKPYVVTSRAKGMPEGKLIIKHPVRVALNPFISTVGWTLPGLVSGSVIVSVVLNLATTGPILLRALLSQDMYLAGTIVLMLSVLTVIGTLISDILLAWLDPRIRLQ